MKAALTCKECGHHTLQWMGRCPSCGAWDSFTEVPRTGDGAAVAIRLEDIDVAASPRLRSGIGEFDRVLGGGLVPGGVVLMAGEPGVGKSTLTLQAAAGYEAAKMKVLLISAEEAPEQVAARAGRVGGLRTAKVSPARELASILHLIPGYDVVVVDSVQMIFDPTIPGAPGSVSQVRSCVQAVAGAAQRHRVALLLIGHVTKDGAVAGPRAVEHLVDAVLTFEGDRGHALRTVRAAKNRFGPTAEVGVFEMGDTGLKPVADASRLLLADRPHGVPGSTVTCVLEGRRPLAVEVQALVVASRNTSPRRVARGFEPSRVSLIAAALERRCRLPLSGFDVFASVAGGYRASEDPAVDLALALALAGARRNLSLPAGIAAVGEVGLTGEVRRVAGIEERIEELARMGFERVLVPRSVAPLNSCAVGVGHLGEALDHLGATRE